MPEGFGKKTGPSWRNLVVLGEGLRWCGAHSSKTSDEECRKPGTADLRDASPTRRWRDEQDGPRVATLLDLQDRSRSCGVRGAERERGLEQWWRLTALHGPISSSKKLDDSLRTSIADKSHKDMRLACILSMCPSDLERVDSTAALPQHAQMKAYIVTVIDSRTRGHDPMMMGNLNEEASNHDTSSDER